MNPSGKCNEVLLAQNQNAMCMIFTYDPELKKNVCSQCQPYHYLNDQRECDEMPGNMIMGESPCVFAHYDQIYKSYECKICQKGFPSSSNTNNECIPFAEFQRGDEEEEQIEEVQDEEINETIDPDEPLAVAKGKKNKYFEFDKSSVVTMRTENCLWGSHGSMGPECMRCEEGYVSNNGHCRPAKDRMDKGCTWRGSTRFDEEGCGPCDVFNGYFAIGDGFCKQFYQFGYDEMMNIQESLVKDDKIDEKIDL